MKTSGIILILLLLTHPFISAQNHPVVDNIQGAQKTITMITDDSQAHIFLVWEDNRNSSQDIFMQKMDIQFTPQWTVNGIKVCDTSNTQQSPDMCTDGSDGVFVVWSDKRNGNWDIYAQHMDAGGNALWTNNGIAVCTASGTQRNPQIAPDSSGGFIVGWEDNRGGNYDIYTQHMDVSGNALWTPNGIAVCTLNGAQDDLDVASDGTGGAVYVWSDARGPNRDIYAERFDPNGNSLWQLDGKLICDNASAQDQCKVAYTWHNDVYFAWRDPSYSNGKAIYGARYYLNGNLAGGFGSGTTGIYFLSESKNSGAHDAYNPVLIPDYRGGVVVCSESTYTSTDHDISAQRVDSTGNLICSPFTPPYHVRVSFSIDNDRFADIAPDRTGGFFAVWRKNGGGNGNDILVRHFDCNCNGTPFIYVCTENNDQNLPHIVSVDTCAYMAWEDPRPGSAGLDIWMDKYCLSCNTPQLSVSANTVNCNGGSDGSATAHPSSPNSCIDTAMFTFLWSAGNQTTQTATGLAAGTYYVTVTDIFGCTGVDSVLVTQPPAITAITDTVNPICFGDSSGSGTIIPSGGSSPYTYNWSDGQTTQTATGLPSGTFYVTVTDDHGCTYLDSLVLTAPSALNINLNLTEVSCNGNADGQASVSVNGGTSPYTYIWSSGGSGNTESGLPSGTYYLTVSDSNGCIAIDTFLISEPPVLSDSLTGTDVWCAGDATGSAQAAVTGGTSPYQYAWSNGSSDSTATGLSAGTYYITITDDNGCTAADSLVLSEPPPLILSLTTADASCYGSADGSADAQANGGVTPYSYNWSSGGTSLTESGLPAGVYQLTLTDGNACTVVQNFTIGEPAAVYVHAGTDTAINAGESVQLNGEGGISWSWSPAASLSCSDCPNPLASPQETTTYYLTVTDSAGCTATDSVTITVELSSEIFVPNIFSPNGDGNNDILYARGNGITRLHYTIYDRWGNKIFETDDPSAGWDGTYHNKALNAGVYVWFVKATIGKEDEIKKKGTVTLIR